jgi:hypothetical protein
VASDSVGVACRFGSGRCLTLVRCWRRRASHILQRSKRVSCWEDRNPWDFAGVELAIGAHSKGRIRSSSWPRPEGHPKEIEKTITDIN